MTDQIDQIDRARTGIAAAGEAMDLVARIASMVHQDPQAKARRMRARAARITARSASAPPRRAERLRSKAARLLVAAESLDPTQSA